MIDREAFARFYRETAPRLERFAARLAGSRAEAEEVVQESYYRFLRSGFAGTSDEERRRYLYRIAVNLMKTRWKRGTRSLLALSGAEGSGVEGNVTEALDVRDVLDRLRPRDRALLWLAYVEGCSHREVGEMMRIGATSVRVLLFRARKRFIELLQGGS